MTIRIQFEHIRPYLEIKKSSLSLGPDKTIGTESSHLYIHNFYHYRNMNKTYLLASNRVDEETYGEDPETKQRDCFAQYNRDSDSIKINSVPVRADHLLLSRKLYENFRRCYLMDCNALANFLTDNEKVSIENELEVSNAFEQINTFQ